MSKPLTAANMKSFGMTIQLVEADISQIEHDHQVVLRPDVPEETDTTYYPQFDATVRAEADSMSHHYQLFYCLEKTIRGLITETLHESMGPNWWDENAVVPTKIHDDVASRIKREVDSGMTIRSEQSLDYTNFGELGEIIKANWDIFGGIFSSVRAMERVLANLNLLRGPIAHCSVLAEDEIIRLELSLRDWFRMME